MSEKQTERGIITALKTLGCSVYSLAQPRATKQTAGLPDLYIFHPIANRATWCEVKAPGKESNLSPAQETFRQECERTGTEHHVWSSSREAVEWWEEAREGCDHV